MSHHGKSHFYFYDQPEFLLSSFMFILDYSFAGLSELSNGELFDLKQEMAAYVKEYSDVLIEELTLREELEREKEVKNKFISTLLAVQSKIRDFQSGQGRGKKGSSVNSTKVTLDNAQSSHRSFFFPKENDLFFCSVST